MSAPIEFIWVTLVAGPDTQPEHAPLAGRIVGVPPGVNIGSGPLAPGNVNNIYGYPRPPQLPTTTTALEWVLSSSLPTEAKQYIANIPAQGWVDLDARGVFETMARELLERGIAAADVGTLLTALHNAAVTNERALPE